MMVLLRRARFEWKKEDCWIGAYWKVTKAGTVRQLDVWICLLPMIPFHYTSVTETRERTEP